MPGHYNCIVNNICINTSMKSLEWTKSGQLHLLVDANVECDKYTCSIACWVQRRNGILYVLECELKITQVFQHHGLTQYETNCSDLCRRLNERFFLDYNGRTTDDEIDRLTLCERMLSTVHSARKIRSLKTIVNHDRNGTRSSDCQKWNPYAECAP